MAFTITSDTTPIRVIVSKDSALHGDIPLRDEQGMAVLDDEGKPVLAYDAAKAYADYQKDLDEGKLRFRDGEEPTRFLMKRVLKYGQSEEVMRRTFRRDAEGKPNPDLTYVMEEVRLSLCGVENPPTLDPEQHIVFTRDNDGGAAKELVAGLYAHGLLWELYGGRHAALGKQASTERVKKSS